MVICFYSTDGWFTYLLQARESAHCCLYISGYLIISFQVSTPPGLGKILPDHLFWSPKSHSFYKSLGSFLYHIYCFNLQNSVHICSPATTSVFPMKTKAAALLSVLLLLPHAVFWFTGSLLKGILCDFTCMFGIHNFSAPCHIWFFKQNTSYFLGSVILCWENRALHGAGLVVSELCVLESNNTIPWRNDQPVSPERNGDTS